MAEKVLHKTVIKSGTRFCVYDYLQGDASFFSSEADAKSFIKTGSPSPDFNMTLSELLEFGTFTNPKA